MAKGKAKKPAKVEVVEEKVEEVVEVQGAGAMAQPRKGLKLHLDRDLNDPRLRESKLVEQPEEV